MGPVTAAEQPKAERDTALAHLASLRDAVEGEVERLTKHLANDPFVGDYGEGRHDAAQEFIGCLQALLDQSNRGEG